MSFIFHCLLFLKCKIKMSKCCLSWALKVINKNYNFAIFNRRHLKLAPIKRGDQELSNDMQYVYIHSNFRHLKRMIFFGLNMVILHIIGTLLISSFDWCQFQVSKMRIRKVRSFCCLLLSRNLSVEVKSSYCACATQLFQTSFFDNFLKI